MVHHFNYMLSKITCFVNDLKSCMISWVKYQCTSLTHWEHYGTINEYYVEGEVKKMMRILKDRRSQGVMRFLKDRRRQWVRYCMVECIILYTLM